MRFSLARWLLVTFGLLTAGWLAVDAGAAEPRSTAGKRTPAARTSQQFEIYDDTPSILVQESIEPPSAGRPPATTRPAPRQVVPPTVYAPHGSAPLVHDEGLFDAVMGEGDCGSACFSPCGNSMTWARFDYLLWWRSGIDLPPLVTTAPPGTPQATAGVLGAPTTSILFGGETEEYPVRPGGRLDLGSWLGPQECFGVGGRWWWLADATAEFAAASTGDPILAIPFFDISTNTQEARLVAFPNTFSGNLLVQNQSEVFGGDLYARLVWCRAPWGRLDLIGGYQYARINEGLLIDSTATDILGATNRLIDAFDTRNEFHGGQIGFLANLDRGCYYVDILGKIGLGNMRQEVTIAGQSISTVGATVNVVEDSGLFAQPSNVGTYTQDQFVVIPELNVTLGWRLTQCLDLQIGYSAIYFNDVVRPNDALDTTVNTTQVGGDPLVGPARPAFAFDSSDFVVHGLNLGVTFRW